MALVVGALEAARQSTSDETSGRQMATDTGKSGRSRPNARARSAALREQQRKKEARRKWLTIGAVVVVVLGVVGAMVGVYLSKSDKKNVATVRTTANPTVVQQVTTIPASTFEKVDTSAVTNPPVKISGPALKYDGKPGVLYYGAEYCPYCATERWPFVVAMSRFGTWSNLSATTSASQDVYPSTPTFSFHGAKYSSPYVGLETVETQTNQLVNGQYSVLETPTAEQNALVQKYDTKGSIPFIDFGNKFASTGASYDPGVLSGKSMDEIAAAVTDPTSKVGKAVLGTANEITAAVCETTGGKPGNVCDSPAITKIRATLSASK